MRNVAENFVNIKWNTEKVNKYNDILDNGGRVKGSPFHDNNPSYRKGNIVYEYTADEIKELVRCSKDIIYFANTYCSVKTKEGIRQIVLRDYQEGVLTDYQTHKKNVFLATRQSGKCCVADTKLSLTSDEKIAIGVLYFEKLKKHRSLTIYEQVKHKLYKIYNKL